MIKELYFITYYLQKYDPERFLSENAATMDNFAFIPFSAGPRYVMMSQEGNYITRLLIYNYCYIFYIMMSMI